MGRGRSRLIYSSSHGLNTAIVHHMAYHSSQQCSAVQHRAHIPPDVCRAIVALRTAGLQSPSETTAPLPTAKAPQPRARAQHRLRRTLQPPEQNKSHTGARTGALGAGARGKGRGTGARPTGGPLWRPRAQGQRLRPAPKNCDPRARISCLDRGYPPNYGTDATGLRTAMASGQGQRRPVLASGRSTSSNRLAQAG